MVFNKITHCGLEKIYNAFKETEGKYNFGSNMSSFLSHISITLDLSNVSDLELIHLYRVATRVKIKSSYKSNNFNSPAEIRMAESILALHKSLIDDEDIGDNGENIDNILPLGVCYNSCEVTFKGSALSTVLTPNISKIFIDPETNALFSTFPRDIDAVILKAFMQNFYESFFDKLQHHDILTDFMMNNDYYKYGTEYCNLAHVNTPKGTIEFINNTQDNLMIQFQTVVANLADISPVDIEYFLTMNTSISTFLVFLTESTFINDYQDMKLLLDSDTVCSVSPMIEEKYSTRLLTVFNELNEYKKSIAGNEDKMLVRYGSILRGQKIKYNIRVSAHDIDKLITLLSMSRVGDKTYDEFNGILSIVTNILSMLKFN